MVSKLYSKRQLNTPSSDLDKNKDLIRSSFEYLVFSLFKVDLINLIKTKVSLAKNFHIQPSEIDRMCMWEYETFIDAVNKNIEEDNARQEEENSKYDMSQYKPDRMMRGMQNSMKMPKMPTMPSMPKF